MNGNITVCVFDLGNVLIPFDYNRIINNLNRIESGLGEKFYKLYKENYDIHRKFERRELSTEEFIKIMLGWLDGKVSAEQFCRIYGDLFTVNKKMIPLLEKLKKHFKLVLLSNTNYIHQKYGWEKFEFLQLFDKWILSHEVGAIKPEPEIYEAVEKFTGESPEKHFFTDDIREYIEGASKRGWQTLQFENPDQFINHIKNILPELFDEAA